MNKTFTHLGRFSNPCHSSIYSLFVAVLVFLVTACQAPAPNTPSSPTAPQVQPRIQVQNKIPVASKSEWSRPEGFNVLNYPHFNAGGLPPSMESLAIQMNYPVSPYYLMPLNETIGKDSSFHTLTHDLRTIETSQTPVGRKIATKLNFGATFDLRQGVSGVSEFNRATTFTTFQFVSTDGQNFTLLGTNPGRAWGINWLSVQPNPLPPTDPAGDPSCLRKVSGNGSMTGATGHVTINHATEMAKIHIAVTYNGFSNYGAGFWCIDRGTGGGASVITLDMEVKMTYIQEAEPSIQLTASPTEIKSAIETSTVTVTPTNKTQPWTLIYKKPVGSTCEAPAEVKGVGDKILTFPTGVDLTNGIYKLEATYDNDPGIQPGKTEIDVNVPLTLTASPAPAAITDEGQSILFGIEALQCPDWELKITGTQKSLFGNGPACKWTAN